MELQVNIQLSRKQVILLLTAIGDGNNGAGRRGKAVLVTIRLTERFRVK